MGEDETQSLAEGSGLEKDRTNRQGEEGGGEVEDREESGRKRNPRGLV